MKYYAGYFWAFISIIMWSFNGIIATFFSSRLSPLELTFGRWFIASLVLFPFAWKGYQRYHQVIKKHFLLIATLSLLGMVIPNFSVYVAGHTTSAVNISLLNRTSPIFIILFAALLFHVLVLTRQILGMFVCFFGVLYLVLRGNLNNLVALDFSVGDLWVLLCAISFAAYSVLQTRRPVELSQTTLLAITGCLSMLMLLPFYLYQEFHIRHFPQIGIGDWFILLYLGIGLSIFGYFSWNMSLAKLGAIKASTISYLTPVLTGVWAFLLLGDQLYWSQLVGGIFVMIGIYLVNKRQKA